MMLDSVSNKADAINRISPDKTIWRESGAEAASSTGDPASRAIDTKAERPPLIDRRPPILGTKFKIILAAELPVKSYCVEEIMIHFNAFNLHHHHCMPLSRHRCDSNEFIIIPDLSNI